MKKDKTEVDNNLIKDKKEKKKSDKALKKVKKSKEERKFMNKIKRKWLISRTNTILLIAILIAVFILINEIVDYLDFTAIDCTTSQDYSLTDESKERVADVDQEVNIYFVGWAEEDFPYVLAKQYNKANSNINVQIVDATEDLEFAEKYEVENEDYSIVVECGEIYRIITSYELYTYDSDYNTIDLTEQKLTSAILNVTSGNIPKVYFLTGYSDSTFTIGYTGGLTILCEYLDDEVLTYEELNILSTLAVPDDCDTLVIMTPEKDFDDLTTDAIIDYINRGGNILWLQGAITEEQDFKNVNKILALYGIEEFEEGIVYETDSSNTLLGNSYLFEPEVQSTDVTEDIYLSTGAVFLGATKINVNDDDLSDLDVTETDLIYSSDTTYFTKDMSTINSSEDESGAFLLGTMMEKTISDGSDEESEDDTDDETSEEEDTITSTLIIYGNDYFATDEIITANGYQYYLITLNNNTDLALNSLAYLLDNDQDITIRKSYTDSETTFTPTDGDAAIIMRIIFTVPIAIIVLGIVVWIRRKNKQ